MSQQSFDLGDADQHVAEQDEAVGSLADDETIDYITGKKVVKLKGSEIVRQRIARALFHEYHISLEDMERDFPIPVDAEGRRRGSKKADIAIFEPDAKHELENLRRVVICKPEPSNGRSVTKLRTYEQAKQDLEELETLLGTEATPNVHYGMWTNGVDFFYLYKESGRFGAKFLQRANWPTADETVGSGTVASLARVRRGESTMLRTAFRRCHNYIHGNEGMPKDAAFWQFLYLLFAKIYDDRLCRQTGQPPRFYALLDEPFAEEGRKAIKSRILDLFEEVKREFHEGFGPNDVISLSPRALAFIVGELAPYDMFGTDMDAKGAAYQELVGINLRGDRGQYFTPRGAVELMVRILDPQKHERVLDPACGTGGFLLKTLEHQLNRWRAAENTTGLPDTEEQLVQHQERLTEYARNHLFGADFDPFLVRATEMNVMTFTGSNGNVYHMNSLLFPAGDYRGVADASKDIPFDSIDVLMTNPPFGTDIKIEDADVLDQYRDGIARSWSRDRVTGELVLSERPVSAVSPEQLFIQRAVQWVKPGGRIGIVLPNGILSNPGPTDEAIRRWILENCWVLASVELPVETFIVDANVNILTSLLFLKKKTDQERRAGALAGGRQDYPVFMAVAEKVGVDRRNNPVYKREPNGDPILDERTETERIRIGGKIVERTFTRKEKVIDNDLPAIADAYHSFREKHPEPGTPR